jgi:hypothetical protein
MKKIILKTLFGIIFFAAANAYGQTLERHIKTTEYRQLQKALCKGWNTWYNNSILTSALLPEGFSIDLCISTKDNKGYLKDAFKAS